MCIGTLFQVKAAKKPAGSFALYLRDCYAKAQAKNGKKKAMNIRTFARQAAASWKKLDDDTKQRYQQLHDDMMERYKKEVDKQREGGAVNYAW